jgi:ABC-2 type transport system permease protein
MEHLLVMPVTPFEIMTGKVRSMAPVVLAACAFSLVFVVLAVIGSGLFGYARAQRRAAIGTMA